MSQIKLLIVDDEAPQSKGYDLIEVWFPGIFSITIVTEQTAGDLPVDLAARRMLRLEQYDIVVLDYKLRPPCSESGLELAQEKIKETPIIGCSPQWAEVHLLPTNMIGVCKDATGLRAELAKFLSSRST